MYLKEPLTDKERKARNFSYAKKKGRLNITHTFKDFYKYYSNNTLPSRLIPKKDARNIFYDFMARIQKEIIYNSFLFTLPFHLGRIYVRRRRIGGIKVDENGKFKKPINMRVDYQATKALWEKDPIAKREKKLLFRTYDNEFFIYFYWRNGYRKSSHQIKKHYTFKAPEKAKKMLVSAIRDDDYLTEYHD